MLVQCSAILSFSQNIDFASGGIAYSKFKTGFAEVDLNETCLVEAMCTEHLIPLQDSVPHLCNISRNVNPAILVRRTDSRVNCEHDLVGTWNA